MSYVITSILFYLIPVAVLVTFVVSLALFLREKAREKDQEAQVDPGKKKTYKLLMILSGVVLGVMLLVVIGFILLLMTAVAFM